MRLAIIAIALTIAAACAKQEPVTETAAAPAPAPASTPAPAQPAGPATADAEKLVAELYREHDADRGPFFQTDDRARLDRFFERSLADLIWNDAVASKGEVGALNFDPLYDAQDVEPKNLTVQPAQLEGTNARVPVAFESYGQKRQVTYVLTPADGNWKISDIQYTEGHTLRGLYK